MKCVIGYAITHIRQIKSTHSLVPYSWRYLVGLNNTSLSSFSLSSSLGKRGLTSQWLVVNWSYNMNDTIKLNPILLDKQFFLGGKATFTVQSEKTGAWRTFRLGRSKPNDRFPKPALFATLLAGPDNTNSFVYIGMINEQTGELRLTGKSRRTDASPDVQILRFLLKHVWSDMVLPNATVTHAGHCGRCGRLLTVPESLKTGIGPECAKIMGFC